VEKNEVVVCAVPKLSSGQMERAIKGLPLPSEYRIRFADPLQTPEVDLRNSCLWIGLLDDGLPDWISDSFTVAVRSSIDCLLFIEDVPNESRQKELVRFIEQNLASVKSGLADARYKDEESLIRAVTKSVSMWYERHQVTRPGSAPRLIREADDLPRARVFVGRDALLQQIVEDIEPEERALVHGFAGTGKTTLAAEAAGRFLEGRSQAEIVWLEAGEADPDAVLAGLATLFRCQAQYNRLARPEQMLLLRHNLENSPIQLFVLDDVWNENTLRTVIDVLPPHIGLLATSRSVYAGLRVHEIDALPRAEALALLQVHAGSRVVEGDPEADALCQSLGDLAFLLELAGKHMSVYELSPTQLNHHLKEAPPRRLALGERDQTIHTMLAISVSSLQQADALAYAALRAFGATAASSASPELLTLILEQPYLEHALEALRNRSLIKAVPATEDRVLVYRVHDITHDYMQRLVVDQNRDDVVAACVQYVRNHVQPTPENLAALEPELPNLRGAVTYAAHAVQTGNAADLRVREAYVEQMNARYADLLTIIGDLVVRTKFFDHRGYRTVELDLLEDAIQLCKNLDGQGENLAILRNSRGTVWIASGQYGEAKTDLEAALAYARSAGASNLLCGVLGNLAILYKETGNLTQSLQMSEESLKLARKLGDTESEAGQLFNLGNVYHSRHEYQKALAAFESAKALPVADRQLKDMIKGGLANIYVETQQYARAIPLYEEIVESGRKSHDAHQIALWEANLGKVYWLTGRDREGIEPLKHSIEVMREHMDVRAQTNAWGHLGNIYVNLGEYQKALDAHREALACSIKLEDGRNQALDYGNIGVVYSRMGNYDEALTWFEKGRDLCKQLHLRDELALAEDNIRITHNQKKSGARPGGASKSHAGGRSRRRFKLGDVVTGLVLGIVLGALGGLVMRWWWGSYIPADGFSFGWLLSSALVTPFLYCAGFFAVLLTPAADHYGTSMLTAGGIGTVGFVAGGSAGLSGAVIGLLVGLAVCLFIGFSAHSKGDEPGAGMFSMLFAAPLLSGLVGGILGDVNFIVNVLCAFLMAITGMAGGMALQATLGGIGLKQNNHLLLPNGWIALILMFVLMVV
jgi:tetratricopeptide (TPR) repeat protein